MHEQDIDTSCKMLDSFHKDIGHLRALDIGAGIGRVTKHVLEPRFDRIDLLDPSKVLLDKAKDFVASPKVDK